MRRVQSPLPLHALGRIRDPERCFKSREGTGTLASHRDINCLLYKRCLLLSGERLETVNSHEAHSLSS
ncbi:hypothetical protein NDU88_001096 [Pleurodeles waltl]|uniref:Uncharacterized protein n=1 Tax=Pleurodeles waltl TaxID=8319 RepID=A0AAV7Q928_PLEWA|nr:hypothetical protein NDU88_001096 [Pleurodeles waltl]